MSRLVPHDACELVARAAFDIEHLTAFQPDEPWMSEVERDRKAGDALR